MTEGPRAWLGFAKDDLEAAKVLHSSRLYPQAIFHLQQANEKLAKGILMLTYILPTYVEPEVARKTRKVFGIPSSRPRAYGHEWLRNFLRDLENFVGTLEWWVKTFEGLPLDEKVKEGVRKFKDNIPNLKESIRVAKGIGEETKITVVEVKSTLKGCRKVLDLVKPLSEKITFSMSSAVSKLKISLLVKNVERYFGTRLNRRMKNNLGRILRDEEFIRRQIKHSVLLIPLGALSIMLNPHEWPTRYPDAEQKIDYGGGHPISQCFSEIEEILRKCLEAVEL